MQLSFREVLNIREKFYSMKFLIRIIRISDQMMWSMNGLLFLCRWLVIIQKSCGSGLRFRLIRHWLGFWLEVVVSNIRLLQWIASDMTPEWIGVGLRYHILCLIWVEMIWANVWRKIHPIVISWRWSLSRTRERWHIIDLRCDHNVTRLLTVVRINQFLHFC